MPFEKNKKKDFCTPCLGILNVEKEFVTCCGAEELSSALFLHLPSVLKSNTSRFSPKKLRGQGPRHEKTPLPPISHQWLLTFKNLHRRCTGSTPTMKGILSLSIISHTVNSKHIHALSTLKRFQLYLPTKPFTNKHDLVSTSTTFTYSELVVEVAVGRTQP